MFSFVAVSAFPHSDAAKTAALPTSSNDAARPSIVRLAMLFSMALRVFWSGMPSGMPPVWSFVHHRQTPLPSRSLP